MGDDRFSFKFDTFENGLQIVFEASDGTIYPSPVEVRKTLDAAVRRIPDSALDQFRSFTIKIAKEPPTK